jgi:hypothetical protein
LAQSEIQMRYVVQVNIRAVWRQQFLEIVAETKVKRINEVTDKKSGPREYLTILGISYLE